MRKLYYSFLVLLTITIATIATSIVLIIEKPRSLKSAIPYIINLFSKDQHRTKFSIDDLIIQWEKPTRTIGIHILKFSGVNKDTNKTTVKIPELHVTIHLAKLLYGQLALSELMMDSPEFVLNTDNKSTGSNFNPSALLTLYRLNIKNAKFTLNNQLLILDKASILTNESTGVRDMQVKFNDGTLLEAHGQINKDKEWLLEANLNKFQLSKLAPFWPGNKASYVREWVLERIQNAKITQANGKFRLKKEYLEGKQMAADAIDAEVKFYGLDLDYFEDLPKIDNLEGVAKFSGHKLVININKGKLPRSTITQAKVDIDFIPPYNLAVTATTKGDTQDLVAFTPSSYIKKLQDHDVDLTKIKGHAITQTSIIIPMKGDLLWDDITFDITTKINEVGWHLPAKLILTHGQLSGVFTGNKIAFDGTAVINGYESTIKLSSDFSDTKIDVDTKLPAELAHFAILDEYPIKQGQISLNSNLLFNQQNQLLTFTADLTNAEINLKNIGLNKQLDQKSQAKLKATLSDKNINISDFNFMIDNNPLIKASAVFNKKDNYFSKLTLEQIKFNQNDCKLDYTSSAEKKLLTLTGDAIDLTYANLGFILSLFTAESNNSAKQTKVALNLKQAFMKNEEVFRNIDGAIECNQKVCNKMDISAILGDHYSMKLTGDHQKIHLHAGHAAHFSRGFGMYKNIIGGKLTAELERVQNNLQGTVVIDKFSAIKTSFLTRLLTLASLSGITSINSSSIDFDKLKANIALNNQVAHITNGVIQGDKLGLTMDGKINITQQTLNLKGTIVPDLYFLNKTLSSLPIVGKLLGGKDQGFIGANYTITGPFNNAGIWVNPLSILTPGFLRGIFDLGSKTQDN